MQKYDGLVLTKAGRKKRHPENCITHGKMKEKEEEHIKSRGQEIRHQKPEKA